MNTPATIFDVDTANKTISNAVVGLVKLMLPVPGQEGPTPEQGRELMKQITEAITTGSQACGEVTRLREEFTNLRDRHRPQPAIAPDSPAAICAACSVSGSLVSWPCPTWTSAEAALTHGQP
ncbi:hypothetical protein ACFXDE_01650 [Kitasatospora sp. NPDC059408]|uniref:hypothetical protein n=1 Tax=Kitasatospora sp. NPDC059408 TaxID=3346823 RepID=UPI003690A871